MWDLPKLPFLRAWARRRQTEQTRRSPSEVEAAKKPSRSAGEAQAAGQTRQSTGEVVADGGDAMAGKGGRGAATTRAAQRCGNGLWPRRRTSTPCASLRGRELEEDEDAEQTDERLQLREKMRTRWGEEIRWRENGNKERKENEKRKEKRKGIMGILHISTIKRSCFVTR